MERTTLSNWSWKSPKDSQWTPCSHSRATTEILSDLIDDKLCPDPFVDDNERSVQWIGEQDWSYMAIFRVVAPESYCAAFAIFEGLDTFAQVQLNGHIILNSDNMFHVHRIDIKQYLVEGDNQLLIRFESALNHASELERIYGKLALWNGHSCRLYARKAQYQFGWDWGPVLLTCGPYRPIHIDLIQGGQILDLAISAVVDESLDAMVNISVRIENVVGSKLLIKFKDPTGTSVFCTQVDIDTPSCGHRNLCETICFPLKKPHLWYPVNYGPQNLYTCNVVLIKDKFDNTNDDNDNILDQKCRLVGIRRVKLIEQSFFSDKGKSFYFEINNIPVFMAGSNWIPAHSLLTKVSLDDYRKWVQLALSSNQNMLRVWGGGIYENDEFYEECQRLGILVWQDMMFACGQYPFYESFEKSVEKECEDQIKRITKFCCVVVIAGNNEDYQIAEWKDLPTKEFPATYYYEKLFPDIIQRIAPGMPYRFGSPWGGIKTSDPTEGDLHQWNVWHGTQERYQDWAKLSGRFISEFGMLSFPKLESLSSIITDKRQFYPQSKMVEFHCKAAGFQRRLVSYVFENLKVDNMDMDSWIFATQLMQADCLAEAYRSWRRNWNHGNRRTGGALVWQLNDCWPTISWSVCDFYQNPKLAYYAIKRENAPLTVCMSRVSRNDGDSDVPWLSEELNSIELWAVNMNLQDEHVTVKVRIFEASGHLVNESNFDALLLANSTTEIATGMKVSGSQCVQAQLILGQTIIARGSNWPQPLKYLDLTTSKFDYELADEGIKIRALTPVKCVEISYHGSNQIELDDNGFDVFPGDPITVGFKGMVESTKVSRQLLSLRCYGAN